MQVETVDVAFADAHRSSVGQGSSYSVEQMGFVRLTASDGTTGVGEMPEMEDIEELRDVSEESVTADVEELLLGRDPRRINAIIEENELPERLRKAVDNALYDLVGRHFDVPVYQLLGGMTEPVQPSWVIYTQELPDVKREIREMVDRGFNAFKLKTARNELEVDAERLRVVRETVGEDGIVTLDVNVNYRLEEAIEAIKRFESIGVDGIESPVGIPKSEVDFEEVDQRYFQDRSGGEDTVLVDELRQVREAVDTTIMEHIDSTAYALEVIENEAIDMFVVGPSSDGIRHSNNLLELADSAGLDARISTTTEMGLGASAAIALGAASPVVNYPCAINGPALYEDDGLQTPIDYSDGVLRPRDDPGLGVNLEDGVF